MQCISELQRSVVGRLQLGVTVDCNANISGQSEDSFFARGVNLLPTLAAAFCLERGHSQHHEGNMLSWDKNTNCPLIAIYLDSYLSTHFHPSLLRTFFYKNFLIIGPFIV